MDSDQDQRRADTAAKGAGGRSASNVSARSGGPAPREEPLIFQDRREAGRKLAAALVRYRDANPVVLALPRGGVPVAAEVASGLGADLDLILARKIGVPFQPELAMGAVVDGAEPITVRNEDVIAMAGVTQAEFDAVRDRELVEIRRRRERYLGDRPPVPIRARTAIVIDDGIATGATVRAALRAVRAQHPSKLVLAIPVAAASSLVALEREADDIVCLSAPAHLSAIGFFYDDFRQISDEAVSAIMNANPARSNAGV
jgi:putative phosphoribosyl transferase